MMIFPIIQGSRNLDTKGERPLVGIFAAEANNVVEQPQKISGFHGPLLIAVEASSPPNSWFRRFVLASIIEGFALAGATIYATENFLVSDLLGKQQAPRKEEANAEEMRGLEA